MAAKGKCDRFFPKKCKTHDKLIEFGKNITSQGGEDGVLLKIFEILEAAQVHCNHWCVEFGAWDGRHLSNTWNLLTNYGWSGVLIEADEVRYKELVANYSHNPTVCCLQQFIEFDGPNSLEATLLRHSEIPNDCDLISIDIDGADYHIWDSIKSMCPKVVVIEFNPTIPNNVSYIQSRDMQVFQGSSLRAVIELGKTKGYELICTTTFNGIFVQKQWYPLFKMDSNDIDHMHDVPMPTEFFQLYDGTIKITGCKKLIWKKLPIVEEKLQMLSKSQRKFPFAPPEEQAITEKVDEAKQLYATWNEQEADIFAVEKATYIILECAKEMCPVYPPKEVAEMCEYAIRIALPGIKTRIIHSVARLYAACGDDCFEKKQLKLAAKWYKQAAYVLGAEPNAACDFTAAVTQKLGEALIRLREFRKAQYWLEQSLAISPQVATYKSLAKIFTKMNDNLSLERVVEKIKALQVSSKTDLLKVGS